MELNWWQVPPYAAVTSLPEFAWLSAEEDAVTVRNYEPLLIPGILQTAAYTEHLFETVISDNHPELSAERMQLRAARSERLLARVQAGECELTFIIAEAAVKFLLADVPSPEVAGLQLMHLDALAAQPGVRIRTLPAPAGWFHRFTQPYILYGDDVLYREIFPPGQLINSDPETVFRFRSTWEQMDAAAVDWQ